MLLQECDTWKWNNRIIATDITPEENKRFIYYLGYNR